MILFQLFILILLLSCKAVTSGFSTNQPEKGDGETSEILPLPDVEQNLFENHTLREKLAESFSSVFRISPSFRELDMVNHLGGDLHLDIYQHEDLIFIPYNQRILVYKISGESIIFLSATQILPDETLEMWLSNDHLYAFNKYGYVILDVSDINNIETLNFIEEDLGSIRLHKQIGDKVFGNIGTTFIVINESNSNRLEINELSFNDISFRNNGGVFEDYFLVLDYREFHVLDISSLDNISLLNSVQSEEGFSPVDAIMIGSDIIVIQHEINGSGGTQEIWDFSNYSEPSLSKRIEIDKFDSSRLVSLSNNAFAVMKRVEKPGFFSPTAKMDQMIIWVKENGDYDVINRIDGVDVEGINDEKYGWGYFGVGPFKYDNYFFWLDGPRDEPSYFSYHVFNTSNPIYPEYVNTKSVSQSLAQFDTRSHVLNHYYEEIRQGKFVPVEYNSELWFHDELPYIFPELDIHQTMELKQWDQYMLMLGLIGNEGDVSKLGRHNIDVFILLDISNPVAPKNLGNPISPHQHSLSTSGLSYGDPSAFTIVNNYLVHLDATAWCKGDVPDICQPEYHIYNISSTDGLEYFLTFQASPRIFIDELVSQSSNNYAIFSDQNSYEILHIDGKGDPTSLGYSDLFSGEVESYSDQLSIKSISPFPDSTDTYNLIFDRNNDDAYVGTMFYQSDHHELVEDVVHKNILYTILQFPECEVCLLAIDIKNPDELTLLGFYELSSTFGGRISIYNELLIVDAYNEAVMFNLIDS